MHMIAVTKMVRTDAFARDRDAAHGFAVSGVGADAEHGAGDGAYAVAEKSALESGFALDEVAADDGAQVLVVCDVLREHDQRDGDERKRDFRDALSVEQHRLHGFAGGVLVCDVGRAVDDLLYALDEREVGIVEERGHADEVARLVHEVVHQRAEVHYLEIVHVEASPNAVNIAATT